MSETQTSAPASKMTPEQAYKAMMAPPTPAIDPNVPPAVAPDAPAAAPAAAPSAPVTLEQLTTALDASQGHATTGERPDANPPANDPQKVIPDPNPAPTPQTKRLTAAELAAYEVELVIDGKPVVTTADKLIRDKQREFSANKRFEEAARMRAEAQAQIEAMSAALDDPDRFVEELRRSGRDPAAIARALVEREQRLAAMTPEERRIAELEHRERELLALEQQRQHEAVAQQVQAYHAAYERDFNAVLDAEQVQHPGIRRVVMSLLADAAAEANDLVRNGERRQGLTKGEARAIIRDAVGQYERPAPPLTVEARRALITAEDVAWYHEQNKAKRVESAPQLARDPRDVIGQPRDTRGKYASPNQPKTDVNGRTIVHNTSNMWKNRF